MKCELVCFPLSAKYTGILQPSGGEQRGFVHIVRVIVPLMKYYVKRSKVFTGKLTNQVAMLGMNACKAVGREVTQNSSMAGQGVVVVGVVGGVTLWLSMMQRSPVGPLSRVTPAVGMNSWARAGEVQRSSWGEGGRAVPVPPHETCRIRVDRAGAGGHCSAVEQWVRPSLLLPV